MMPNQTKAALTRHWGLLLALIAQIVREVTQSRLLRAEQQRRLFHLIRLAESLARRWLMLKAGVDMAERQTRQAKSRVQTSQTPLVQPGAAPRLRLVEPDPILRAEDFGFAPFAPVQAAQCKSPGTFSTVPSAGMVHRMRALQDVLQRPAHHTARMARWLRRAALAVMGRRHPLRVGRPPGRRRWERSCPYQTGLCWLDTLARDSLLPGWVP